MNRKDGKPATRKTATVRLLSGFDQWVLGPGSADGRVVPPGRRPLVSRQAGWISPVVVTGGVVSGTWARADDEVTVALFREARMPRRELTEEVARLGSTLDRPLRLTIHQV